MLRQLGLFLEDIFHWLFIFQIIFIPINGNIFSGILIPFKEFFSDNQPFWKNLLAPWEMLSFEHFLKSKSLLMRSDVKDKVFHFFIKNNTEIQLIHSNFGVTTFYLNYLTPYPLVSLVLYALVTPKLAMQDEHHTQLHLLARISKTSFLMVLAGGVHGVMIIVAGYGYSDTSSNPEWLHSHSTYTLGKGMNPNILPPAIGK